MPVPLKLPVVIAVLRPEQIERLHIVRMRSHFRRQHLIYFEAAAVIDAHALGEAPRILRIAPKQDSRSAAGPKLPLKAVALRVTEAIRVSETTVIMIHLFE